MGVDDLGRGVLYDGILSCRLPSNLDGDAQQDTLAAA